ncbi:MAG: CNP1-like family protein [Pseudomonadota bacterium]
MNLSRTAIACIFFLSTAVSAQRATDNPDWKEIDAPPPAAVNFDKLVIFPVSVASAMVFGVDPDSIRISPEDNVVRYVVVATSPSGARNVFYEGIRCGTGEVKNYARYSGEGRWVLATRPEWKSLYAGSPSQHSLRLAQAGGCMNAASPISVDSMVRQLRKSQAGS